MSRLPVTRFAFLASLLAAPVAAQGLITTQGVIVATDGDPVPNASGSTIPGLTFGGSNALSDNPVVDETGRLFFRARMTGGTQTITTERAYFYGASRADLRMVVRGGDAAPGMPNGVVIANAGGAVGPFPGSVRVSPAGHFLWGTYIADPLNGTVSSGNDEALFGGLFGAQTLYARQGDLAPGTVGATFVQAFSFPNITTSGINREGRVHFTGTLTGGDVIGTLNQGGLWAGMPGALELVARRGSPAPGLPGTEITGSSNAFGSLTQMNDLGRLLYQATLSTTSGSNPATSADDQVLFVHTPGVGSTVFLREGTTIPGTFNGVASATMNAVTGDSWDPDMSPNSWTRTGETIFRTEMRGGDSLQFVTDLALCRMGPAGVTMIARSGTVAPGTNALFENWHQNSLAISQSGRVAFQGTLMPGLSSLTDDSGLWAGTPGSIQLILREGDTLPGTGGATADHISGGLVGFNDIGQLLFTVNLVGGSTPGSSLWLHDPVLGFLPLVLPLDSIETAPGVFKSVSSFAWVPSSNCGGAALGFGHDGRVALRLGFTDGTGAIATVRASVNVTPNTTFCFGDGSGTACPCGNSGAAGHGCASSVNPAGALLSVSGFARISVDSLRLTGTSMPNASALYFQGTSQQGVGLGIVFGDGLRCASGTIARLGTKTNQAGTSTYPGPADPRISVRGMVTSPGPRSYQVWYRNAASFCTASTFNLSNGVQVTWFL